MKTIETQTAMRKAKVTRNKYFKFGQSLKAGEEVLIQEEHVLHSRYKYTAFRPENETLGFGLTANDFEYTDSQKFIVAVSRTSYSVKNIEVIATSRKEAEQLAIEEAGNQVFSEQDSDYGITACFTEGEHKNLFE